MTARKLLLTNYMLSHVRTDAGEHPTYRCRESLAELCFVHELQLTGSALLKANDVAQAILSEPSDAILLTDEQYGLLSRAIEAHAGFTRNDVELVRRVREAETVAVDEKPQTKN